MQYKTILAVFLTVVLFTSPGLARTEGLIDFHREDAALSIIGGVSTADYEQDSSSGDTEFNQSTFGIRYEKKINKDFQAYVQLATISSDFDENDVDASTVFGGGFQYVVEPDDDFFLLINGSYMEHSSEQYENNSNNEIEVVDDYQVGLILGKRVKSRHLLGEKNEYSAWVGGRYSGREVEHTVGGSVRDFDYADASNLTFLGGAQAYLNEKLMGEIEVEGGAVTSGTARLIYNF